VIGHHWSSSPSATPISLHSGQLLRVKSVACFPACCEGFACLLALKRLSLLAARYSASQVLVIVLLFHRFVSLNYSFIINKLFVVVRTIDRHYNPSLGSSEWVKQTIPIENLYNRHRKCPATLSWPKHVRQEVNNLLKYACVRLGER